MANLSDVQRIGRAKNALSMFLDRRLVVPKIFLDATWNGEGVDVLAIDRAGVGDVHAVQLITHEREDSPSFVEAFLTMKIVTFEHVERLLSLPCQYKYLAVAANFSIESLQVALFSESMNKTFAEDGIGRIGIFFINASEDDLKVQELVKAERFRSTKEILALTDTFVQTHTADMEYRDPIYDQEVSA